MAQSGFNNHDRYQRIIFHYRVHGDHRDHNDDIGCKSFSVLSVPSVVIPVLTVSCVHLIWKTMTNGTPSSSQSPEWPCETRNNCSKSSGFRPAPQRPRPRVPATGKQPKHSLPAEALNLCSPFALSPDSLSGGLS